jgi:CRISPR-associated endonuclease Csn1
MPLPWDTYREHVQRAVNNIWVSHKPDHSHEGAMHNDTAYALLGNGRVSVHKTVEGVRTRLTDNLKVIEFTSQKAGERHGFLDNGDPRPYKGYKGDSNYCIEIVRNEKGKWEGDVISTFEAYQIVRTHGQSRLSHAAMSTSGKPLVMRLIIDDVVSLLHNGEKRVVRLAYAAGAGTLAFVDLNEANVDKRTRQKELSYVFKTAGSLQKSNGRRIGISPIGELRDPGFKE